MAVGAGAARVIAVVGPTATGKSDLAVQIALGLGGEVVNADSMQLYRGMDIGTAKLPEEERRGIPHHLLDVLEVTDESTLAAYQEMSRTYQPDRTNVILMLTDGDNDNPGGLGLDELMTQIESLASPSRPIPVITIAFGPDVQNLEPLQEIAAATGGAAYMTEDPTEIGEIFLQAFSLRISEDTEQTEGAEQTTE